MLSFPAQDQAVEKPPETMETLERLLTQNRLLQSLFCEDGEPSCILQGLATIAHLKGTPEQLQSFYNAKSPSIPARDSSPARINDFEQRQRFLGDIRFQRAYMDYFSLQLLRKNHNIWDFLTAELFPGDKPLLLGLFGGLGYPLMLLSDGIELPSAFPVVSSLVIAAVRWSSPLHDLLCDPQLASPILEPFVRPDAALSRIAYDGQLSGIMKSGPGFEHVNLILSNRSARAAVIQYARLLDLAQPASQLRHLADLAVGLLCGTHKKDQPAFDIYLAQLVTLIHSVSVLLPFMKQDGAILVRGAWILFILAYITQLRPTIDPALVKNADIGEDNFSWGDLFSEFRGRRGSVRGRYLDANFHRTLRSLFELGHQQGADQDLYLSAAWKLRIQWKSWVGTGARGEETVNIRL